MRVRRIGLVIVSLLGSAVLLAQELQDRPQFRAGVEILQLDVSVLDGKRQPVRGLKADDFTVLDNGTPTTIRAFTPVELAASTRATEAVWSREVAPDVTTNNVGAQDGRLVIIVMDRTIGVGQPTVMARKIATAAVNELGPNDLAAVVSTANGAMQDERVQNLTADRSRLLQAVNYGDPSTGLSAEAKAIWESLGLTLNPLGDGRCLCGVCVLEAITRVADAIEHTSRRRKVLLFIGSTMIWQATAVQSSDAPACEIPLRDARATLFAAIDRVNLTVHAIDPQGLSNLGPQTEGFYPSSEDRFISGRSQGTAVVGRLNAQRNETTDLLTGQKSLEVLPARTGGRTVVSQNDPDRTIPAIYRESEAYYVLGIERAKATRVGDERAIEVKVKRKDLRVVTQRHYVSQAASTMPSAGIGDAVPRQKALAGLLPDANVPLSLAITAFANPDSVKPVVRVNIDTTAFARADGSSVPLNVKILAVDRTGRPMGSATQTSTIAGAGASEIIVSSHLELGAGDYGIRVAISEEGGDRTASVFGEVTVPSFDDERLSLSGVNVESATSATAEPTVTTRRIFQRSQRVRAVFQIYQGIARSDAIVPVSMRVQILDAKGVAVRDQTLPFAAGTFTNRRANGVLTLPLANLPVGEYLLKLEASADRTTAGRALRFAVE